MVQSFMGDQAAKGRAPKGRAPMGSSRTTVNRVHTREKEKEKERTREKEKEKERTRPLVQQVVTY